MPKNQHNEYFLTIGFDEHHIYAAVGKIAANTVTIVGTGESEFHDTVNVTEAADIAISTAEKNISENILIERAIFGVPVTLLEQGKIKSEYLAYIKKISNDLSLKTQGFIEYPQALAYFLETKEESPPTLLLLSIADKTITLSLIHVGKVEQSIVVPKTPSLITDFEQALEKYTTEIMPSRIMLFDETRNAPIEEHKEELLRFPWQKNSSFLHTPKIEVLPSQILLTALVETVGGTLIKELRMEEETAVADAGNQPEIIQETVKEPPAEVIPQESPDTFGFVQQTVEMENEEPSLPIVNKKKNVMAETTSEPLSQPKQNTDNFFSKITTTVTSLIPRVPRLKLSFVPILAAVLVLAVVGLGGWYMLWSYPHSKINLIVYPLTSSQQIDIALVSDSTTAGSNQNVIVTQSIQEEVKGDKTAATTGKTKIGEAAKGSLTVYNKTLTSKSFPKGTVLLTGNLRFLLDNEVTIASASDTGEGLTFGKTSATVTAAEIGPEANLDAGKTFTLKDLPESSYYAKNTEKFTGGTSRDVDSVSKDDQDKLLTQLTQELTTRGKQLLTQKVTAGYKLLDNTITSTIVSKTFSKNVGDEAKELSLSLDVTVKSSIFNQSDLIQLTNAQLESPPSGYSVDKRRTSTQFNDIQKDKKNNTTAKATVTAYYIPVLDTDKIISELTGKTFQQALEIVRNYTGVAGIEIVQYKSLFFLPEKLPINKSGIQIQTIVY